MINTLKTISQAWTINHFITVIIFTGLLSVSSYAFICQTGVNCLICLNSTFCQSCHPDMGIASDASCGHCTDYANCQTCNGSNLSQCSNCVTNFTLTSDNICHNNNNCTDLKCLDCPNNID